GRDAEAAQSGGVDSGERVHAESDVDRGGGVVAEVEAVVAARVARVPEVAREAVGAAGERAVADLKVEACVITDPGPIPQEAPVEVEPADGAVVGLGGGELAVGQRD